MRVQGKRGKGERKRKEERTQLVRENSLASTLFFPAKEYSYKCECVYIPTSRNRVKYMRH